MRKRAGSEVEGQRLLRAEVERTSQSEVARKIQNKQQNISRWLSGEFRPDGDARAAMYAVFGWHPNVWLHSTRVDRVHSARKRRSRSGEAVRA